MSTRTAERTHDDPVARLEAFAAALEETHQRSLESFRVTMEKARPRAASARLRKHHHILDQWAKRGYSLETMCQFLRENFDVDVTPQYLATLRHRERRRRAKEEETATAK